MVSSKFFLGKAQNGAIEEKMEDEGCLEGSASASTQGSVTESVGDLEPASIAIQEEKAKVPIYESGSEEDCIRGALLGLAWGDAFGFADTHPFMNPPC